MGKKVNKWEIMSFAKKELDDHKLLLQSCMFFNQSINDEECIVFLNMMKRNCRKIIKDTSKFLRVVEND